MSTILSLASKKNAPLNSLPARETPKASPPSMTATRSVEAANRAGVSVYQEKEVKPPLILPNAPLLMDAMEFQQLKNPLLLLLLILNNASKKNVPTNGLLAKRTLSASPPSKIVKRNVELVNHAGLFVSHPRAAKPQSMLPSVLMLINALDSFQHSKHAFINPVKPITTHAFLTYPVDTL